MEEMEAVMPWAQLLTLVTPNYPNGETGRKPVELAIMLHIHFLKQWTALSDPAAKEVRGFRRARQAPEQHSVPRSCPEAPKLRS